MADAAMEPPEMWRQVTAFTTHGDQYSIVALLLQSKQYGKDGFDLLIV
jgi:hypothetical protein